MAINSLKRKKGIDSSLRQCKPPFLVNQSLDNQPSLLVCKPPNLTFLSLDARPPLLVTQPVTR